VEPAANSLEQLVQEKVQWPNNQTPRDGTSDEKKQRRARPAKKRSWMGGIILFNETRKLPGRLGHENPTKIETQKKGMWIWRKRRRLRDRGRGQINDMGCELRYKHQGGARVVSKRQGLQGSAVRMYPKIARKGTMLLKEGFERREGRSTAGVRGRGTGKVFKKTPPLD